MEKVVAGKGFDSLLGLVTFGFLLEAFEADTTTPPTVIILLATCGVLCGDDHVHTLEQGATDSRERGEQFGGLGWVWSGRRRLKGEGQAKREEERRRLATIVAAGTGNHATVWTQHEKDGASVTVGVRTPSLVSLAVACRTIAAGR